MRKIYVLLPAAFMSTGAAAQSVNPPTQFSIEFKLAPRMSLARPYTTSDYTDATTASVNFKVTQELGTGLTGSFSFGPSITFDDDNDPPGGSGLNGNAELAKSLVQHWAAFTSYGIESAYKERFGEGAGTNRTLKGGLRHKRDDLPFSTETSVELAALRVNSSLEGRDYRQLGGEATVTNKFLSFAHLSLNGGIQRQFYEHRDVATGRKPRDWQFLAMAGLNFAPLVTSLIEDEQLKSYIGNLTVAYRYVRVDSTIESREKATHSLAPVISLRAKFPR